MNVDNFTAQQTVLPSCVILVLQRQIRQRGWLILEVGQIECGQLVDEDADRPFVTDDMVQVEEKDMSLVPRRLRARQLQEGGPEQGGALKVEGPGGVHACQISGVLNGLPVIRQVDVFEGETVHPVDCLTGLPVNADEARSQRFVAANDFFQCSAEDRYVEVTLQKQRSGHVVGWTSAGRHLVDHPQASLGIRQNKAFRFRLFLLEKALIPQRLEC